jgi:hypothetical protein
MAGDWIKVRCDLPDDPAVFQIARKIGITPEEAVGRLCRVWIWADRHVIDGHAFVTLLSLDRIAGEAHFGDAMVEVGWLEVVADSEITFPKFDRHNGKSAKRRVLSAERQQLHRNAASVTKALPEKRREEKSTKEPPLPPKGGDPPDSAEPPAKQPRAPDLIWDAVVALWWSDAPTPLPASVARRCGAIVRELKSFKATPEQIHERYASHNRRWPTCDCTADSIVKHWYDLAKPDRPANRNGPASPAGIRSTAADERRAARARRDYDEPDKPLPIAKLDP